jgi:hypothetical protein
VRDLPLTLLAALELVGVRRRLQPRLQYLDDARHRLPLRVPPHPPAAVFVHVPKAAGSALKAAAPEILVARGHVEAYRFARAGLLGLAPSFAIVRDPADRFRSAFNYLQAGGGNPANARWAQRVLGGFTDPSELLRAMAASRVLTARVLSFVHFRPQVEFVCDSGGDLLVDHLLAYERLAEEWRRLCDTIGIPQRELPVLRRSPGTTGGNLGDAEIALLRKLYAEDYRLVRRCFGGS